MLACSVGRRLTWFRQQRCRFRKRVWVIKVNADRFRFLRRLQQQEHSSPSSYPDFIFQIGWHVPRYWLARGFISTTWPRSASWLVARAWLIWLKSSSGSSWGMSASACLGTLSRRFFQNPWAASLAVWVPALEARAASKPVGPPAAVSAALLAYPHFFAESLFHDRQWLPVEFPVKDEAFGIEVVCAQTD